MMPGSASGSSIAEEGRRGGPAPSVRAAALRSSGMVATEPAMISVMKGIAFQAMAMIDAERPVVADELRQAAGRAA